MCAQTRVKNAAKTGKQNQSCQEQANTVGDAITGWQKDGGGSLGPQKSSFKTGLEEGGALCTGKKILCAQPTPRLPQDPAGQPSPSPLLLPRVTASGHLQCSSSQQTTACSAACSAAAHTLTRAGSSSATRSITSESAASSPRRSTSVSWPSRPPLAAATMRFTSAGAACTAGSTRQRMEARWVSRGWPCRAAAHGLQQPRAAAGPTQQAQCRAGRSAALALQG